MRRAVNFTLRSHYNRNSTFRFEKPNLPIMKKDLFSVQAKEYAQYRPTYPTELYQYLATLVPNEKRTLTWPLALRVFRI